MRLCRKFFLGALLVTGLQALLTGCHTDGYIGVNNGVYYGPHRDPWFRDDPWMDGHRWYRGDRTPNRHNDVDLYISPPRLPRPPRIRLP
jgi:hypothetical protein